jgi:hypothetical protein
MRNKNYKVSQMSDDVLNMEDQLNNGSMPVNQTINDMGLSNQIESFAKPNSEITVKDDSGTVHSFAVEVKSSKNGPIPDTQLMSRILQAIENNNSSEFKNVNQYASEADMPKFEVVSFKYERRDDKKR